MKSINVTAKTNKVSMRKLQQQHSADLKEHFSMNRDKVKKEVTEKYGKAAGQIAGALTNRGGSKTFIVPRPSIEDLKKQDADRILKGKNNAVIFEYIKRNKRFKTYKVGVIIGIKDGKAVKIGWSKCNLKIGDVFDPVTGIKIATSRAVEDYTAPTPKCVQKQVRRFGARCARYFKGVQRIEFPLNA